MVAYIPLVLSSAPPTEVRSDQDERRVVWFALQRERRNGQRPVDSFSDIVLRRAPVAHIDADRRRDVLASHADSAGERRMCESRRVLTHWRRTGPKAARGRRPRAPCCRSSAYSLDRKGKPPAAR